MIDPTAVTSIDPPPGGEHLNIMISACGTKVWVCIDGTAVFRYRNLQKITIEDLRTQGFREWVEEIKELLHNEPMHVESVNAADSDVRYVMLKVGEGDSSGDQDLRV